MLSRPNTGLPCSRRPDSCGSIFSRLNTDEKEQALFARAKQDDTGAVAGEAQPIGDAAIDAVIKRVQAAFAAANGAALPVRIQKVRDMQDLPPALQETGHRQQVGKLGEGVFFEDVVYVVQEAHSTAEQVETTIFHGLYGHAATSALFGNEWTVKLNALFKAVGGAGGIVRLSESNGLNLQAYMDGPAADETLTDDLRRAALMDELLAHIAEKKTVFRKLINEFIGAVRNWLRVHGFAQLAEYGNTDLAYLLAEGRRAMAARATGAPAPRMPVFARDDAPVPVFYSRRRAHRADAGFCASQGAGCIL